MTDDTVRFPDPLDRPLEGVRVLDFTQNLPGPYATMILLGLGAEVIKVEPPSGDTARGIGRLFEIVNAGKKSVVLDLKTDEGRRDLRRLVPQVDVVVEGFRPGVMAGFGCGPVEALHLNPRLVYCSISGYGQAGPYASYPGHDLNLQAITGVCHMMRMADGHPLGCAIPIADLSSGLTAVAAITAALFGRERDGRGRAIDVALTDTVMTWAYVWSEGLTPEDVKLSGMLRPLRRALGRAGQRGGTLAKLARPVAEAMGRPSVRERIDRVGEVLKRSKRWEGLTRLRLHALPHYGIYRTRDGRWLSVGIVDEHKFWRVLCEGLGLPRRIADLSPTARLLGAPTLRRMIGRAFRRRDLADWLEHFDRERIPIAPVLPLAEALRDPHLATRRNDPAGDVVIPYPLSQPFEAKAPPLGAHTAELLGH
jgi:crotonobetainyl-CoA:carnitine CoA-transferase CaiB-like acyl-CoA transferase